MIQKSLFGNFIAFSDSQAEVEVTVEFDRSSPDLTHKTFPPF